MLPQKWRYSNSSQSLKQMQPVAIACLAKTPVEKKITSPKFSNVQERAACRDCLRINPIHGGFCQGIHSINTRVC